MADTMPDCPHCGAKDQSCANWDDTCISWVCGKTGAMIPDDDDTCDLCGADRMDGCHCHDNLLGFPEGCPSD